MSDPTAEAWQLLHRVREIALLGEDYQKPYQLKDRLDLIRSLIDVSMAEVAGRTNWYYCVECGSKTPR